MRLIFCLLLLCLACGGPEHDSCADAGTDAGIDGGLVAVCFTVCNSLGCRLVCQPPDR